MGATFISASRGFEESSDRVKYRFGCFSGLGGSMAIRFVIAVICIFFSVGLLDAGGATEFSKSSKSAAARKKNSTAKIKRTHRNLVLRSASVLVKDQQTGELLVQKQ